jgi:hypothetical protein
MNRFYVRLTRGQPTHMLQIVTLLVVALAIGAVGPYVRDPKCWLVP